MGQTHEEFRQELVHVGEKDEIPSITTCQSYRVLSYGWYSLKKTLLAS